MLDGELEVDCHIERSHGRRGVVHQGQTTIDQTSDDATLTVDDTTAGREHTSSRG